MDSPAEDRPGYLAKQVQLRVRQAMDAALRPLGLTTSQYSVLLTLAQRPGIAAAELARLTFVSRQSLQDVLGGLRRAELVEVATTGTGRRREITLTPRARDLVTAADDAVAAVERRMVAGIAEAELRTALEVLRRCRDNLTTEG
jgi:DNA-binding MarR family transcriptional regulator